MSLLSLKKKADRQIDRQISPEHLICKMGINQCDVSVHSNMMRQLLESFDNHWVVTFCSVVL
jgi:hypothetical protein